MNTSGQIGVSVHCSQKKEVKSNFLVNESYGKILDEVPSQPTTDFLHDQISIFHLSKQNDSLPIGTLFYPIHANCKLFRAGIHVYYFPTHKGSQFPLGPLGAAVILIILIILIILLVANLAQHLRLKL